MTNKLSLTKALKLLKKRKISSTDLVKDCLEQINQKEKLIQAFITINQQALEEAKKINSPPTPEKPLLGVPMAIKDNFLTQGLKTTAASKVLQDYIPQYSATVVSCLKQAGAIILGKTNMDAWAHGSSTETSDFKTTKNPWNRDYLPGGSSGGSAAAVVSDMCIAAIGSETAGSIRQPSAWCGCIGLKPTYGRVSRYGVIAMGSSLDSPGPLSKTVEDSALILEILSGKDPLDASSSDKNKKNFTSSIGKGIKHLKIGIAENYLLEGMADNIKDIIRAAASVFEDIGAQVDYVKTMDPRYAIGVYTLIQRSEVSSNLARYDGIRFGNTREYFGQEAKRRIMLGTFALSKGYADQYYKKAQKVRTLYIQDFERVFKEYDLIVGPTSPGHAQPLGASKGKAMFGEMEDILVEPSTISGLPGISVPCGFVNSLPIGLNIMGPQFSEAKIIQAAQAYQAATDWHKNKPDL